MNMYISKGYFMEPRLAEEYACVRQKNNNYIPLYTIQFNTVQLRYLLVTTMSVTTEALAEDGYAEY